MDDASRRWLARARNAAQAMQWHRRLLAAGLAAAAAALALHAAEPAPAPTVPIVVATRDLPGGAPLAEGDLGVADVPAEMVPAGAMADIGATLGRMLAGPVRAGEPVTDVRLVGASLVEGWGDGLVAVPVRIADPGVVTIVRPGDRVDLLAASLDGSVEAGLVAAQVPVLAVPPAADGGMLADGALLVVAVTTEQATMLAQATVTSRMSVALR
jgi:pilus assembly protein CpaB